MLFENHVSENKAQFLAKVREYASALKVSPDVLMAVMMHESGLNHRATNSIGCVGLIQFCPGGGLTMFGVTADQMRNMTNVQQLYYVYRFFLPIAGQGKDFADYHLYAFVPSSFPYRNNPNHIIGSEVGQSYAFASQNSGFDLNKNNAITIGEFRQYAENWLKSRGASVASVSSASTPNIFMALAIGGLVYYLISDT